MSIEWMGAWMNGVPGTEMCLVHRLGLEPSPHSFIHSFIQDNHFYVSVSVRCWGPTPVRSRFCPQETHQRVDVGRRKQEVYPKWLHCPRSSQGLASHQKTKQGFSAPPVAGHSWLWKEWPISMLHTPVGGCCWGFRGERINNQEDFWSSPEPSPAHIRDLILL